jgi:hypothetical protein
MPPTKNNNNNSFRKVRLENITRLPASLRRDPLPAGVWRELEGLQPQEALELPGRGSEARRIGRAVARFGREKGWEVKVFSADGNCYVVRIK